MAETFDPCRCPDCANLFTNKMCPDPIGDLRYCSKCGAYFNPEYYQRQHEQRLERERLELVTSRE